ncbi:hypothetical protein DFQ28_004455, partial [Apophysomyces sp. BC1034]
MQHQHEQPAHLVTPVQMEQHHYQPGPMTGMVTENPQPDNLDEGMESALASARTDLKHLIIMVHQKRTSGTPDGELEHMLRETRLYVEDLQKSVLMAREPKTAQDDELSAIAGKLLYQAPRNLPLFQWHGVPIQDETKTVFANAFDFMTNFEVILKSNRLSLDENWECLLP